MTHPVSDLAIAGLFVVAIGAGTLAILPRQSASGAKVAIDPLAAPVQRSEPLPLRSDAERIDALQRQLAELAGEQKRLTQALKKASRDRRQP